MTPHCYQCEYWGRDEGPENVDRSNPKTMRVCYGNPPDSKGHRRPYVYGADPSCALFREYVEVQGATRTQLLMEPE